MRAGLEPFRVRRRFTELVYRPQLELLAFLRANAFGVYIVSGVSDRAARHSIKLDYWRIRRARGQAHAGSDGELPSPRRL